MFLAGQCITDNGSQRFAQEHFFALALWSVGTTLLGIFLLKGSTYPSNVLSHNWFCMLGYSNLKGHKWTYTQITDGAIAPDG